MMTTLKNTKIIIDDILHIQVEEPMEMIKDGLSECRLIISTRDGKYEISLQADFMYQLHFDPDPEWITPKVYKGESNY
jgi:hypothetical protein